MPACWQSMASKCRRPGTSSTQQPTSQAAGITLAHGGQAWQDATVFEAVALGIGGPEFFNKAFVELDQATLKSGTMKAVFDQMRSCAAMSTATSLVVTGTLPLRWS